MTLKLTRRRLLLALAAIVLLLAAVTALMSTTGYRARRLVSRLEYNSDDPASLRAANALRDMGAPAAPYLVDGLRRACAPARPSMWSVLLRDILHLGSRPQNARFAIVAVLARIGDPAVPSLAEALDDPSPELRQSAIQALAIMEPKGPAALDLCAALVNSGYTEVAHVALWQLAYARDPRALAPIRRDLPGSADPWTLALLLHMIGGDEAESILARFAGERDIDALLSSCRDTIARGANSDLPMLRFLLERYGTLEMAADFRFSRHNALSLWAGDWAKRQQLETAFIKAQDSPARPKWGRPPANPASPAAQPAIDQRLQRAPRGDTPR